MTAAEMNSTFREFALMFIGKMRVDEEIPFAENLDRSALDGSIESLSFVDAYLAFVQENLEHLTDSEYNNVVLRCGGYVGECIRMTWPESYDWCDYNDYMPLHPEMHGLMPERTLGTCALLEHFLFNLAHIGHGERSWRNEKVRTHPRRWLLLLEGPQRCVVRLGA
jgi:hypothetical protein